MLSHGLQILFTGTSLTVVGLLLFFTTHVSIITRILFTKSDTFKEESLLPLSEEVHRE